MHIRISYGERQCQSNNYNNLILVSSNNCHLWHDTLLIFKLVCIKVHVVLIIINASSNLNRWFAYMIFFQIMLIFMCPKTLVSHCSYFFLFAWCRQGLIILWTFSHLCIPRRSKRLKIVYFCLPTFIQSSLAYLFLIFYFLSPQGYSFFFDFWFIKKFWMYF